MSKTIKLDYFEYKIHNRGKIYANSIDLSFGVNKQNINEVVVIIATNLKLTFDKIYGKQPNK